MNWKDLINEPPSRSISRSCDAEYQYDLLTEFRAKDPDLNDDPVFDQ